MRAMTVIALLAGAAALTQVASAAAPNAPAKPAVAAAAPAKPPLPGQPPNKLAGCEKTWRDQGPKKHTGKHKAFIAACMAKG